MPVCFRCRKPLDNCICDSDMGPVVEETETDYEYSIEDWDLERLYIRMTNLPPTQLETFKKFAFAMLQNLEDEVGK